MWSRIKEKTSKAKELALKVAHAGRFSRAMTGGYGGILFVLGSICKVSYKNFFSGYGPAISAFVVAMTTFIYKVRANYKASDLEAPAAKAQLKQKQQRVSTQLIAEQLNVDADKTVAFLRKLKIADADIQRLQDWTVGSNDDLHDVIDKIFKAIEFDLTKYPVSFVTGIMATSGHFMECMMLQIYGDMTSFAFAANVPATAILGVITSIALIQGILQFFETKAAYEHPGAEAQMNAILKAYDKYETPQATRFGYGTINEV